MGRTSKIRPEDTAEIARRMKLLRATTGLSQAKFAESAGLAYAQWSNFEAGSRPGIDAALALVRVYGVTLDWVYLGVPHRMPHELMTRIAEIEAEGGLPAPRARRRRADDDESAKAQAR